jgi:alpha-mannosidase
VAANGTGSLEWVAFRYAPRETAFGILPIPAHPAKGSDPHEGQLDYAVWFTERGDARHNRLPHHVRRALRAAMFEPSGPDLDRLANGVVVVDRSDVQVTALKPAYDGRGVIVRLSSFAAGPVQVRVSCPTQAIAGARLCDARERDLEEVAVQWGAALVPVRRSITSVRVRF